LGSTPAIQRYKVRLCRIKAHEIAVFCARCIRYQAGDTLLDGRLLHNRATDSDSVCRGPLGSTPASQWYKVHLGRIGTQEIAVFCAGCIRYQAGDILLDGRLLHTRRAESDSVCRGLLGSTPATQWYKVYPSATFIHDVTGSRLEAGLELKRVFCQKAAYEYRCFYVD